MDSFKVFLEGSKKGNGFGCLMLYFTNELKKDFLKLTKEIDPDDLYKPEDGFGAEDTPHVTVKYGLHENDHDKVFTTLGKIDPIPVKFKRKVSLFENKKFDVVKINMSGMELRALNRRVCSIFDYTDNFPVYQPHSTIAYVTPGKGTKYLNLEAPFMGEEFLINKLVYSDDESNKKFRRLK